MPYTEEIGNKICTIIATSNRSIRSIAIEIGVDMSTIMFWLRENDSFANQYARAKEMQADYLAEEMLEIADDASQDIERIDDFGNKIENKEFVNRSRLRVDTRKWIASKLKPKKYGDKIEATINPVNADIIIKGSKFAENDADTKEPDNA